MNIILLEKNELVGTSVCLGDDRAKHIVKILRASSGDSVKVGIIDGPSGSGVIRQIVKKPPYLVELEVSVTNSINKDPLIDIVLALPRPIMFKRVLSQATALGVGSFHIVNARRVEKSFWDSNAISESKCRKHLIHGLEQAVDTRLPEIRFHKGFKPFVENVIPELRSGYKYLLVAHPGYTRTIREVFNAGPGKVLLAVGPEGGWSDYEIDKMEKAGFVGFGLGRRILKVDTAVVALHSMISVLSS